MKHIRTQTQNNLYFIYVYNFSALMLLVQQQEGSKTVLSSAPTAHKSSPFCSKTVKTAVKLSGKIVQLNQKTQKVGKQRAYKF